MRALKALAISVLAITGTSALAEDTFTQLSLNETTESKGLQPSKGYYFARIMDNGIPDSAFNSGKSLYFYISSQPQASRWIYGATMGLDREIVTAGTPRIANVGLRRNGKYESRYSGITSLWIQGANGGEIGYDVALGPLEQNSTHVTFTLGQVPIKFDDGQTQTALVVTRSYPFLQSGESHEFGEEGIVTIFPGQVAPDLYRLRALKILANDAYQTRILAIGETRDKQYSLHLIGLDETGALDSSFGTGGVVALPGPADERYKLFVHKPPFAGDPNAPVRELYVGRVVPKNGRWHIEVAGYDAFAGAPIPGFTPIDLRVSYAEPQGMAIETNKDRIVIVSRLKPTRFTKQLIAVFNKDGTPRREFSGDGKRLIRGAHKDLYLHDIALSEDNKLYITDGFKAPKNEFLSISRWLVDDANDGRSDSSYGLGGAIQLNNGELISNYGESLAGKPITFTAKETFVEPLANGRHRLIVTGAAIVQ